MSKKVKQKRITAPDIVEDCGCALISIAVGVLIASGITGFHLDQTTIFYLVYGLLHGIVFIAFASYMDKR